MRVYISSITGLVLAALALTACSGFAEVADGGLTDGPSQVDAGHDAITGDGPRDSALTASDGPDLGGKLAAGECCGKNEDCASDLCISLGQGPAVCSAACTASAVACPVGFDCGSTGKCFPPSEHYQCGPQVAKAKPQGLGGCCGKATDCLSGLCHAMGGGAYFCSQSCTTSPDTCPVKYICGSNKACAPSGAYSCSYK